jgi:uncharacterized membrane protein YdbT with pleckstrin-like domain
MAEAAQQSHFGNHTLVLMMFRRALLAFVALVVSGAIAFIGPSLAYGIAGALALGGAPDQSTASHIASFISYADLILFLASIIFGMVGVIIALLEYRNHTFELDELSINIRKGLVDQFESSVPYHQIRDVSVMRTATHQLFGTSRLTLVTSNHEDDKKGNGDTVFDPIDADVAERIRSFLEQRIGIQIIQQSPAAASAQPVSTPVSPQPPQNHA